MESRRKSTCFISVYENAIVPLAGHKVCSSTIPNRDMMVLCKGPFLPPPDRDFHKCFPCYPQISFFLPIVCLPHFKKQTESRFWILHHPRLTRHPFAPSRRHTYFTSSTRSLFQLPCLRFTSWLIDFWFPSIAPGKSTDNVLFAKSHKLVFLVFQFPPPQSLLQVLLHLPDQYTLGNFWSESFYCLVYVHPVSDYKSSIESWL